MIQIGPLNVATCLLVTACGSNAEACPTRALDEYCHGGCVENVDEAIASICAGSAFPHRWLDAENDCGGKTVESDENLSGVVYHFDAKSEFVGVKTWTDTADDKCGFEAVYGRRCEISGDITSHDCPMSADAGWRDKLAFLERALATH